MSTGAFVGIVIAVVVVLAVVGVLAWMQMRRKHLREQFGPEYDRTVENESGIRSAERELAAREKRHAELDIKPLSDNARDRYVQQWAHVQEQFVDRPGAAVAEADRLVTVVMAERGYPTEGYEQQVADLSVRHAAALDHYRTAHDVKTRHDQSRASTEELREAMVHYRSLFEDLLNREAGDGHNGHRSERR
jgi:hypothetical protein